MCGIAGIWGGADNVQAVESMMAAMNHRGPDDRGLYHDAQIALGMTRLAILNPSPDGHQPMSNPNRTVWIVYNGEVYNFETERHLLETHGYTFSSSSDTEVVLRMYEHYGDEFLLRLRGMFALAIYDQRRGPGHERLLLARDYFGIKPLLYTRHGNRLIFASEVKALLASGFVQHEIDPVGLRLLLTYGHVLQPRTILQGVSMLAPSHYLVVEPGRECLRPYWSLHLNEHPGLRNKPYEELVSEMAEALRESLRMHLVSDVPVGAFLSGGVDSSLLTALMTQVAGSQVKTFSVGFGPEGAEFDEGGQARKVAEFLGTKHTSVLVLGEEVRDRIRDIAVCLDQPSMDGVNTYFVARVASEAVKVVISGVGSDELFAGYSWFINMLLRREHESDESWSSGFLSHYKQVQNPSFTSLEAARLLHPDIRKQAQAGRSPEYDQKPFDELAGGSTIERISGLCLRDYLSNQLLRDIDSVSMAHSLEVRAPFVDRVVADIALSLPDYAKLNDSSRLNVSGPHSYRTNGIKRIIMDVARPLLPQDFDLQPKRGFLLPFDVWMRGTLNDVMQQTLSEARMRSRQLLDFNEVCAIKQRFLATPSGHSMAWVKPWLLMMFELWCGEVLDRSWASPVGHGVTRVEHGKPS